MSVIVKINTVDQSDLIEWETLSVVQNLTNLADTASFAIRKYGARTLVPAYDDDVEVWDGSVQIFGGKILKVEGEVESGGPGVKYLVHCTDHIYEMDKELVSKIYTSETIEDIIADIISNYTSGFTVANVSSTFIVDRIVFNQVTISECLRRLADIVQYNWYVDSAKDVHFFSKFVNSAPYNLTDTSGNFVYKSLKRITDGTQVVNRAVVRGGEYDGDAYEDTITVVGSDTKSFKLPYRFSNLGIELDTGGGFAAQTVGVDFVDSFSSYDVLHNVNAQTIKWNAALSAGDLIKFSGNPKTRVLAVSEDPASIAAYGTIEKLIRDDSIESNEIARSRASAELYAYANAIVDAKFQTYNSGLLVGMVINVQSTRRDSDDDLLIKTLTFSMLDPNTFGYSAILVSTKRNGLIEILRSLLAPRVRDTDESEVAEAIFTDTVGAAITELNQLITPEADDATLAVAEDELVTGTEPDWVLSPYTPTGMADTKRTGRLDRSMKLI